MHQFLKTILTTTCFTLALTTVHASDDEGELADLSGGESAPSISSLLLQQIPKDSMNDSTANLTRIFETGGQFSHAWHAGASILSVVVTYDPTGKITPTMASFRSVEGSLSGTMATTLQGQFFAEGENSVKSRSKRARKVAEQQSGLAKILSLDKTTAQILGESPEIFGPDGLKGYTQTTLAGSFNALSAFTREEEELDQKLLQSVLTFGTPLTFTYAFPRTDGVFSDIEAAKEKGFGNNCRNFTALQSKLGTISFTFSTSPTSEPAALGDRTITLTTGLSDVVAEVEALTIQNLNLFLTTAAMKSGTASNSFGMYS